MASETVFTKLNELLLGENGVYQASQAKSFDYSDGEASERALQTILSNASDLRSDSAELESHIVDWPTEYHLSSKRANLLRGLNLDGVSRVLDLGCGCGSNSRYLGEQEGLQIDAVDGSSVRAALAALRCRDLQNVTISSGNFNEMQFPENHYDLILFVGVTEYAGRFSQGKQDQQALQDLLALAKSALSDKGVVLIAIENRVGLKYLMGACEDHYGKPYVGLDDYPDSTGIRTYTKPEWQAQIAQAGFSASKFSYPFPDYKVPTLMIGEQAERNNVELATALSRVHSRDYVQAFEPNVDEARIWHGLLEAGLFEELSNSFLILVGEDQERIDKMHSFGLIEYEHSSEKETATKKIATQPEKQLKAQLRAKQLEVEQLRQKITLITGSRGWRALNKIRRLLGLPTA